MIRWDFMMIGVTKWKYSQSAIDERQDACDFYGDPSDFCKNEAWFIRTLSEQLKEKFEVKRNLTFSFMDSFSQSGPNLYDEVQQSHWTEETNKLWSEATSRNETFDFKTIDDVLEENALCKEENNRLNDIISEDIKQLKENITTLDNKIIRNGEKITDNHSSMVLLSKDVDDLTADVEKNSANITEVFEDVAAVQADVITVASDVEENSDLITNILDDVVSLTSSYQQQEFQIETLTSSDQQQTVEIESLSSQIDSLGARGHWCGYQHQWTTVGTITYERLTFSDSNMNITATPLDINTGRY